ncbi:unnamed protein product [Brachionus calyciflorus]|uniref:FERM domain-containing protein n=1 Tax=Brachionus calyciflorus TaxID=104777 RepID=A0A814B8X6_9BILA|nr:unnamed protein product [Brachionus calyciflorus]
MSFFKKLKNSKHLSIFSSSSLETTPNHKILDSTINSINNTNTLSSTYSNSSHKYNSHTRSLVIYHIDSETEGSFSLTVKNEDLGESVIDRVCDHFSLTDYKEYFGLKYTLVDEKGDYEIFWLDPIKQVGKQLKNTNNILTFRVKHFPGKPELIDSEYVRYLIFLQIRNYLLKGDLQLSLLDETQLAAYAVQAAIGDYDPQIHKDNYLSDIQFLSRKSIKAEESIREIHKQLKGKTPAEMELAFLEKASKFDTYGAELIVVKNSKGVLINFGVSHNGIITFLHGQPHNVAKIGLYPWTQIGKISYESKTLKVHAHTPDNSNSEVIKKHVMVFRCNNSRICKHLWKFILDQKAFFNFKRGSDVPRIKSSSSLFSHKSRFRFSGRCESELIASQAYRSTSSLSPKNIDSLNTTQNTNSFERSATLNYPPTFKRRTFMSTFRPTGSRHNTLNTSTSDTEPKSLNTTSDTNNNNLKPTENLDMSQTSSNATAIVKITISETSSTNTQKTLVVPTEDTELNTLNQQPNLTSTPQITTKQSSSNLQTKSDSNDQVIKVHFSTDDENDKFYDHDDFVCQKINSKNSNGQPNMGTNDKLIRIDLKKSDPKKNNYFNYFLIVACFGLFYWIFFTKSSSLSIFSLFSNNLYYLYDYFKFKLVSLLTSSEYSQSLAQPRWVQWSLITSNSSSLDPLISWFLTKYRPN